MPTKEILYYLGIDVGSVSTKLVLLGTERQPLAQACLPTHGQPSTALKAGLLCIQQQLPQGADIALVAVTGSAREMIGQLVGADIVKNEVTCQAAATLHYYPQVRTIIEIGGQDSKIILIKDGHVADFGMNTICAAGTGSFIDHQAQRLGLTAKQLGDLACLSKAPAMLSGRCTVFAESEMIHKQQSGASPEDIVYGLCQTLVHNYLNSVASGKEILPPVIFQGGLSFNRGIVRALQEELRCQVVIPPMPQLMGAIGAALLATSHPTNMPSHFKGFCL
ncbi:MAG: acyl-CoA dehydratase activase [Dehalococcoidia bacterium]|nr:acyl-CoA dehydratase activase [Dehalococcoidia bacterium]